MCNRLQQATNIGCHSASHDIIMHMIRSQYALTDWRMVGFARWLCNCVVDVLYMIAGRIPMLLVAAD